MDVAAIKVEEIMKELDRQRKERGISFQAVADACGISQTTIMRIFKGKAEPTITMLQSIAAAVQYVPEEPEQLPPSGCSNEQYTEYFSAELVRREGEYRRHIMQLQTHYSILNRQNRRVILGLVIAVTVLVIFLVGWLIFDIMHPEIGWIQR